MLISFFTLSLLLYLPVFWVKGASPFLELPTPQYRLFFTYHVALIILYLGVAKTGKLSLIDVKDLPFTISLSLTMGLAHCYLIATLYKPKNEPWQKKKPYKLKTSTTSRIRTIIKTDHLLYLFRIILLILGASVFYTMVVIFILSGFITLEPHQWRIAGYITYPACVALGVWGVRIHYKKYGYDIL